MGRQYDDYIRTIPNASTRKTLKSAYKHIGDYEDSAKSLEDVKRIFYATKVDTPQAARSLCSQFRQFANYIEDQNLVRMLDEIDYLDICLKVRALGVAKYFSNEQFQAAFQAINNSTVMNPFYTQTLFLCIYEGVYSRDFSVLINLRASDIHGNTIICRRKDGTSYEAEVSDLLAESLIQLAESQTWICRNRNGYFERDIYGEHHDSCFKVEKRDRENRVSPPEETYVNTYRNRLREIVSTELGYNIAAFEVYISGIMHRISLNLSAHGISVYDAFAKNNRDMQTRLIIEEELKRSHYDRSISQFKQRVEGHLELYDLTHTENAAAEVKLTNPGQKRLSDEAIEDYIAYADNGWREEDNSHLLALGVARPKLELISVGDRHIYPRSRAVARIALVIAEHKCEIDSDHPTFISKSRNVPYTEPHHLVPLAYADNFDVSLDVPENIVSLCSNCHNEIHYGKDITQLLRWLYENRKSQLEQVGIKITFDELVWMYDNAT